MKGLDCLLDTTRRRVSGSRAAYSRACQAAGSGIDATVHRRWHQFYVALSTGSCDGQLETSDKYPLLESVSERRVPYKISYNADRYWMISRFFTSRPFWL